MDPQLGHLEKETGGLRNRDRGRISRVDDGKKRRE
jgi:hypothetical protein